MMNNPKSNDEEPYGDVGAGYTSAPGRVSEIWLIRLAKVISWFKRKKIK